MNKNLTKTLALATTGLLALALASCTPHTHTDPTASAGGSGPPPASSSTGTSPEGSVSPLAAPSRGPVKRAAPQTEDEAIDAAFETATRLWALEDELSVAGKNDEAALGALAISPYLNETLAFQKEFVKKEGKLTGSREITLLDAYTSVRVVEDREKVQFGYVGMDVCNDIAEAIYTFGDGSKSVRPKMLRSVMKVGAFYDSTSGVWLVETAEYPEAAKAC